MRRRSVRTMSALAGAVVASLLLTSVATSAASPAGSPAGSLMEAYKFNDTAAHPGVTCYYQNASNPDPSLLKVKTNGPNLYARDRTGGADHQTVAWRFVIEGAKGGTPPYTKYYTSSWLKATSDDSAGHKFGSRSWVPPLGKNRQWRVHVEMRWYKPGSSTTVEETIKIFAQYYTRIYPPIADDVFPMPCLPGQ